ncbi:methylesterase 10-like isoform X1 [Rhododendron vialii]|uniref:methylesterase 10-like isoform X1 n=1 Tax=Rhododendron vialii TaxID=182163 RepID=UPI00265EF1C7|nr:methylesterase 10-like isoform X1 [Rhododendron vialii]
MCQERGKHFVLVHGACHGAWCWYKLKPLLQAAGHRVTALDLGGCGVHPSRLDEIVSLSDYLQPLMDFMASLVGDDDKDRVVLVGHSFGGLGVSLAMERFPEKISVAVFITAYMPNYKHPPATLIQEFLKRTSMQSVMDCQFAFDQGPANPPTSVIFGPEYTGTIVYQHCQPKDVELAKMLLKPNGLFVQDLVQESILTEARYGSVRRVYVVCEEDGVMGEEFQRWLIENSPPKAVKSMAKAGHMVMLSKPKELALCLKNIVDQYH